MQTLQLIGAVLALIGSLFLLLGAIGVVRMPDLYNRIHAGTKATTLGNILTLTGLGLVAPGWLAKVLLVVLFVILTNPLSSHALARAALRAGIPAVPGTKLDPTCPVTGPAAATAEEARS